jgi:hypothetical protein
MDTQYLQLRPNYEVIETFDDYFIRVKDLLPNFPQPVFKQWFFDHFESVITRYSWLGFEQLSFRESIWKTERIIKNIKAWNELAVENWKFGLLTNSAHHTSSLVTFMLENGTWPIAPIVLDNPYGLSMPDKVMIARWELIEGHHRLACFRALHTKPEVHLLKQHSLWIASLN